jgi:hypothetical protein
LYERVPEEQKDAFYQLVLFPVEACANLNRMYHVAAKNRMYANQERVLTNAMADSVELLFHKDQEMSAYFHTKMADGKWNYMMSQTHIGYTYWQQPEQNNIPETERIKNINSGEMGVAVEGSEIWWPNVSKALELPVFFEIGRNSGFIELFNRGAVPFQYELVASKPWIVLDETGGEIETQERILVSADWKKMEPGNNKGSVTILNGDKSVTVRG